MADVLTFRVEIEQTTPTPTPDPEPEPVDCEEYGRVTRIYASGYQRTRGHLSRLTRGERRCLVVDFNGAIPMSRSIASVTWRTNHPHALSMASARIAGRTAVVDVHAQSGGRAVVKVEATLDNGEVYPQMVEILIQGSPWFEGEATPAEGVRTLTATA